MKTKEEIIREAYGNLPENYKDLIPEINGWSNQGFMHEDIDLKLLDTKAMMHGIYCVRPKSLNGIETNNGWTKIESEFDLPKENGYYYFRWNCAQSKEHIEIYKVNERGVNCPTSAYITHYQTIKKPLPPLF